MANTKIHITFDDGTTREYTVSDEVELEILNGRSFIIESAHPDYAEMCIIKVGVEIMAK